MGIATVNEMNPLGHFVRLDRTHGYETRRDYKKLYSLAKISAVVCFLEYGQFRSIDVATTMFHHDIVEVSARGTSYIYADNEADFIKQCEWSKLEYILPLLA